VPAALVVGPRDVGRLVALLDGTPVLLLTGGPGVGKSTTLDALAATLALRPGAPRLFRTTADDTTRRRPFGLVAGLVGLEPAYPPPADQAERVLDRVERLCDGGPVVLIADDVHQADPDSLAVLVELAAADLPLTMLLAARPLPVREQLLALAARPGVAAAEVGGLDDAELGALVADRYGAPPGPALRALLARTGGNPFHARALLDDLHRRGRLALGDGELEVHDAAVEGVPDSVRSAARAQLAVVDARTRELLQVLAVWGRPVSVARLAETTGAQAVSLLGPVQAAVAAGLARWTPDGELLEFRHDLYREVTYADLDAPLRRVLHDACATVLRADGRTGAEVLHHEGGPLDAARALEVVRNDLGEAPAQAADLLADARARSPEQADAVAIARAQALAAAGDMRQAERVARERIAATTDPAAAAALTRVLLHILTNAADVAGVLAVLDRAEQMPLTAPQRQGLARLRQFIGAMAGRGRPDPGPDMSDTGAALTAFVQCRSQDALRLALRDAAVDTAGPPDFTSPWHTMRSGPIWPAIFAASAEGLDAARQRSLDARRLAQQRGQTWLSPGLLFLTAGIDYSAGRWDDALAEAEAGLEAAAASGSGWISRAVATVVHIRVQRGQLDSAAEDLAHWKVRGLPEQLGLPMVTLGEMLLAEARGERAAAVAIGLRCWEQAMGGGRTVWALLAGVETARVAEQSGHAELVRRIAAESAAIDMSQMPGHPPAVELVAAMAARDGDRAAAAASAFSLRGNVVGELWGWEEAAVAAAARGRTEQARTCAARCTELAGALDAVTVARRVAARLRDHDVRLRAPVRAGRPTSGWGSLTPTELTVADLVGQGLTSPQIAAQLFLSPRTVQTHISHSLRKLDLRTRSELAAMVARHS
jgi:DNA-binding CsgD family transcriptional regulator